MPPNHADGDDHPIIPNGHMNMDEIEEDDITTEPPDSNLGNYDPCLEDFGVNAILIDFFLYDTMKQLERDERETIPHHRTRSIWY